MQMGIVEETQAYGDSCYQEPAATLNVQVSCEHQIFLEQ